MITVRRRTIVDEQSVTSDLSTPKAMTIKVFLLARLEKKRRLNVPVRMVVMGGLEPPTPAL